ncbi:hypothetical protein HYPSUDRAFT_1070317 [Hypholoma sublateritium FD-334 SS-4]|uniref:Enoyl-CoA hydratase n=1 Tax=Hypholoma sublateritium (strain FD-334 SS-4) TaxID=945553 RepID=A0A0D2KK74_HYPSF|nr:hypothetical protein HYPSUDRAFT_1070317 [Hypholoma sublateritium FD-334 SS-4]
MRRACEARIRLQMPPHRLIAAIDSPALGGGLSLSLACDLRVAGNDVTKIGLLESGLGIIPGASGTQRAMRLLGLAKAKDLIFTGQALTSTVALEWGYYVSTPGTTVFDHSLILAEAIARNAPLALRAGPSPDWRIYPWKQVSILKGRCMRHF